MWGLWYTYLTSFGTLCSELASLYMYIATIYTHPRFATLLNLYAEQITVKADIISEREPQMYLTKGGKCIYQPTMYMYTNCTK